MKKILTIIVFTLIFNQAVSATFLDIFKVESGLSIHAVDNHRPYLGPNLGLILSLESINFIFATRAGFDPFSTKMNVQGLLTFEYEYVLSQVPIGILAAISMGYSNVESAPSKDGVLFQAYIGAIYPLNQTLDVVSKIYGSFRGSSTSSTNATGQKQFLGTAGIGIDFGFRFSFSPNWKLKY